MNLSQAEPPPWPRHRWWLLITCIFAAHIGLIFAFGNRELTMPRSSARAPALLVTTTPSELMELNDPTLFALPHPRDFAAAAWIQRPEDKDWFPPYRWTEDAQWLALSAEKLGDTFLRFSETNTFARLEPLAVPVPVLSPREAPTVWTSQVAKSTLQVLDNLAQRRWLNPVELPSWPAAELLTNSVVRVWVDSLGNVLSATLERSSSGSREADQKALELAKAARFSPLPTSTLSWEESAGPLTRGVLVFKWHTITPPATNAPGAKP